MNITHTFLHLCGRATAAVCASGIALNVACSNDLQASDASYVECDFRPPGAQIDISLHDDADQRFDDANAPSYAPLPGFGDHARYLAKPQQMRWVDVVRGSIACEARFTMTDSQINGDWKQAAGKGCDAALSLR